jgi:hypothetical protein
MRKTRYQSREQLVLELERINPNPPLGQTGKGLVQTLADLLLEALGEDRVLEKGGRHEHQDHA